MANHQPVGENMLVIIHNKSCVGNFVQELELVKRKGQMKQTIYQALYKLVNVAQLC